MLLTSRGWHIQFHPDYLNPPFVLFSQRCTTFLFLQTNACFQEEAPTHLCAAVREVAVLAATFIVLRPSLLTSKTFSTAHICKCCCLLPIDANSCVLLVGLKWTSHLCHSCAADCWHVHAGGAECALELMLSTKNVKKL
jgi:hypothetical protein